MSVDQPNASPVKRRPAWRRVAGLVRRGVNRAATVVDPFVHSSRDGLLPPAHLRIYYYRTWDPGAFDRAGEQARVELVSRGLRPEHRVLDVGSGIGNLALALTGYLHGGFDGIEIHPEAVQWCQKTITPRFPSFRFHRADVSSRAYNPGGAVPANQFRFPFANGVFDYILLASVFTHMLPADVESYVQEMDRRHRGYLGCLPARPGPAAPEFHDWRFSSGLASRSGLAGLRSLADGLRMSVLPGRLIGAAAVRRGGELCMTGAALEDGVIGELPAAQAKRLTTGTDEECGH